MQGQKILDLQSVRKLLDLDPLMLVMTFTILGLVLTIIPILFISWPFREFFKGDK